MQTDDRQTDGRAIAYSEREREFTFAKKLNQTQQNQTRHAKFHLDPSNRLATIHQRYRLTDSHTDRTDRQDNGQIT